MVKNLVAKCGKTGFRSIQGLKGHERLCPKCQVIEKNDLHSSTQKSSTQKQTTKDCQHNYRLLTEKEKALRNHEGKTPIDLGFDAICAKCGEMK